MSHNLELGKQGEELAKNYLLAKGYTLVEENWRWHHHEVDLIVCNDIYMVFVEVKTRSHVIFGEPEVFVTQEKQQKIIRAANAYMLKSKSPKDARFDIVSVVICNGETSIKHLPNAYGVSRVKSVRGNWTKRGRF
ncbi:MAG: YraN family protein [Bacteroidales bacterium]|nr:YraN family protein [Bacteroidales bacterium]